MIPDVVMRPILATAYVNQILPSGPTASEEALVGIGNSVITPSGVILPNWAADSSVNHRLPSGPTVIDPGCAPLVGTGNSVMTEAAAGDTANTSVSTRAAGAALTNRRLRCTGTSY